MGAVDGISEESLFEFKFSPSGTSNIHKLQAVLYSYALNQNTNVSYNTKVVNLCTGEIESLNYDFVLSDDVFQIFFSKSDCEDVDQDCDAAAMTIPPFSIVPF